MVNLPTDKRIVAGGLALLLALGGGYWALRPASDTQAPRQEQSGDPGKLSDAQMQRLGIRLAAAAEAGAVPLGTVPGVVTLPPEARVAVTSPFAGTAVRVLVIQGQDVERGQPLAVVRAAETVQFGAELARAEADLAFARVNAGRLDTLAREGIVAGVRADEARASMRRTEATIRENRRLLSMAGSGGDGTVTLRAPISGRVASVAIDTGAAVGGGGAAPFVVENSAALTLDLQVPERLAGQVRPGMAVDVVLDGAGAGAATVPGRILSIGSSIDPMTRSVPAKASLVTMAGLVPGKSVMAIVSGDAASGQRGISVPTQSVARIEGQDYVFVRNGGRFERRKVTVVAEAGGRSVLSAGLKPGERIAVSGVAELKSLLAGQ